MSLEEQQNSEAAAVLASSVGKASGTFTGEEGGMKSAVEKQDALDHSEALAAVEQEMSEVSEPTESTGDQSFWHYARSPVPSFFLSFFLSFFVFVFLFVFVCDYY